MKRIVVRIITYNQENVIRRALDSVLCQKEWGLYRIVVSDDCSKDNTWDILQEYYKQYPDILDIHRNEHNLGIYGNVEKSEEYLQFDYDLFCSLAGDDSYCDGYFEAIQRFVENNNIDSADAIGIYSDWVAVSANGEEYIHKQDAVLTGHNLWSLKARGKICGRSLMVSKAVRDHFEPVLKGKGLSLTETHYDSQPHLNIKKAFYLPVVTSVYYIGIGVSTNLSNTKKSDYFTTQSAEMWNYSLQHFSNGESDEHYIKYKIALANFYMKPTLKLFINMLYHYNKGLLSGCKDSLKSRMRLFGSYLIILLKQ